MSSERAQKAKKYFESGYNCSQAVACAFADVTGMSEETAARLVSGFGGGMGRLREVCGAFSGIVFVLSCLYGEGVPAAVQSKAVLYKRVQECACEFKNQNGSLVCRELLGLSKKTKQSCEPEERSKEYYKKRPCSEIVEIAADILDNYIKNNKIQ